MPTDYGFGQRPDLSPKGPGFNQMMTPDGDYVTELSTEDGGFLHPLVYPGVQYNQNHLDTLMAMASGAPVDPWSQRDLYGTSLLAAMQRAREGLSPYWTEGVDPAPRVPVMGNFDIWY